jgi:hypothetical protein
MLSILKSDITWQPEPINDNKFALRANKSFVINSKDFEDYNTGINLKFGNKHRVVFKTLKNELVIANNLLEESNYDSMHGTKVRFLNYTDSPVHVAETEYFLTFELIERIDTATIVDHSNETQTDLITEPVADPVAEPVSETLVETVAEPVVESVETVAEPVSETVAEPVVEPVVEPVTEPVAEPVVEPVTEPVVEAPKKRKYVKKSAK